MSLGAFQTTTTTNPLCVVLASVLSGVGVAGILSTLSAPLVMPKMPTIREAREPGSSYSAATLMPEKKKPKTPKKKKKGGHHTPNSTTEDAAESPGLRLFPASGHGDGVADVASSRSPADAEGLLSKCTRYSLLVALCALLSVLSFRAVPDALHYSSLFPRYSALYSARYPRDALPTVPADRLFPDAAQMAGWLRHNTLET